jgi:hypothetical protein
MASVAVSSRQAHESRNACLATDHVRRGWFTPFIFAQLRSQHGLGAYWCCSLILSNTGRASSNDLQLCFLLYSRALCGKERASLRNAAYTHFPHIQQGCLMKYEYRARQNHALPAQRTVDVVLRLGQRSRSFQRGRILDLLGVTRRCWGLPVESGELRKDPAL